MIGVGKCTLILNLKCAIIIKGGIPTMIRLESILEGINRKDERSWEQLYAACYAALCTYTESFVSDMDTAKDIVQELMGIWNSDAHFSTSAELLSYLYKSLHNNSLIYIRNKKTRERILDKLTKNEEEEEDHDFSIRVVREEVTRLLYMHIRTLPRMRRKIVELSINGFSGKEIASKLGISINTVKVQKNRSIKYLRDCLINVKTEYEL